MKPNEITSNRLLSNYLKININDLEKLIKNNYIITHDRSSEILEILQYNLPKNIATKRLMANSPNHSIIFPFAINIKNPIKNIPRIIAPTYFIFLTSLLFRLSHYNCFCWTFICHFHYNFKL